MSTTDADGDTVSLSYAWYVDGSASSATGSTLDGSTWFDKGESVYVVVTPNDGDEGIDDLLCELDSASTDVDGDSLAYSVTWTVDGSSYTGSTTTYTGDTVDAADTAAGEEWECTLIADDGDDTASATDSVTVLSAEYDLNSLCGRTTGGLYCGGNCTSNTSEYADAYCQIGGYSGAASYTEVTSGSHRGPMFYYQASSVGSVPSSCSEIIYYTGSYGTRTWCTCVDDLTCSY